ncbi:hypothetical protein ScPMuIL_014774 [Solemya velum]
MAVRQFCRKPNRRYLVPTEFMTQRALAPDPRQDDRFMRQKLAVTKELYQQDLKGHYGCVNAIEFSNGEGDYIASGGDDRRVMLWNVIGALSGRCDPVTMKGEHNSNIFCLAYDTHNNKIFSGGNDEQVIVHDIKTGQTVDVFMHDDVVYGLSADPVNEHVFASACDDGRILVYDIREPPNTDPFCLASYTSSMHAVMYNPMDPRLIASANAKEGIGLWDIRHPRTCMIRYSGQYTQQSFMSVRINRLGDKIIGLRRRFPPVLFHINSSKPLCEFDQTGYYNSCTMKSCSFAGDRDQYILSGSDDFSLYMWRIPDDIEGSAVVNEAHLILKGHRSIVNQVRFNPASHLICSSGVEKVVKVWSPFPLPKSSYKVTSSRISERPVYTHEEYINLVLRSGHVMSHDYSHQSKEEDPRMMAFFDSLVQRELEGWSSEEELSSNDEEMYDRIMQLSHSEISDSDSHREEERLALDSSDDDTSFRSFTLAFASVMAARAAERSDVGPRLLNPDLQGDFENISNATNLNQDVEILEGQRPNNTNRRSISQLILQKKKEIEKIVSALKNVKKRKKALMTSSDSSDDESPKLKSLGKHSVRKMNKPLNDSLSSTSIDPLQRQRTHAKLKRLKQLRVRVLKSDSEVSDVEMPSNKAETSTILDNSQSVPIPNTISVDVPKVSLTCPLSECKKSRDNSELGPYLSEAEFPHSSLAHPSTVDKKHSTKHTDDDNANVEAETMIPTTDLNCSSTDDILNNLVIPVACACTSNTDTTNNNAPSTSTNQNNVSDPQPVWTEFKRFKHRLEKARRYYRRHSQEEQHSSDDN